MPNPANLDDFIRFDALLEAALEDATKEEVAACARLRSVTVGLRWPLACSRRMPRPWPQSIGLPEMPVSDPSRETRNRRGLSCRFKARVPSPVR
jgi:hypothetical protein